MTEKAERTIEKKWLKKTANLALGVVFAFLFFILSSSPVEAGNQQITFQGKLTNSSGNTVSNGTYYLKLTIYDAASAGTCQYTASSTCSSVTSTPVTVTNGIFSINLGDTSASLAAISPTLFNNSALYLGITVCSGAGTGCDSEMTPRKRLTAAPYAFNADYLSGLATSTIGGTGSYVPVTDSSGNLKITNSFFVASTTAGQFGVGTTTVPSGVKSYVEGTTATDKLLVIRGNSSQSGNLQEWQNSAGTALMSITSAGNVSTSGSIKAASSAFFNVDELSNAFIVNNSAGGLTSYIFRIDSDNGKILFDETNVGNKVGIGTGAPSEKLTVIGNVAFADGSTTSTLTKNSLILGQTSTKGVGTFYVDSSGNVSASGSLRTFANVTSTGIIYGLGGLISSASSTFSNALNISGTVSASSTFQVTGDATFYGALIAGSNTSSLRSVYLSGLTVTPNTQAGTLYFNSGDAKFYGYTANGTAVDLGDTSGNNWSFTTNYGAQTLTPSSTIALWSKGSLFASSTMFIGATTASSTVVSSTAFILGKGANWGNGVFSIDANGGVSTSGTLNVAGGPDPIGSVWHPTHKSSITDTASYNLRGNYSVFVSGNYAYIASQEKDALTIIDVSNPASTTYKGSYTNATLLDGARSVFVSGNYAYVIAYIADTLAVIDISNPANPVLKGSLTDSTNLSNPNSIFVSGNYAYIVASAGAASGNLAIVDVSNPANPVLKSTLSDGSGGAALLGNTSIFVSGKYAYITTGYTVAADGLEIVDISNPLSPVHAGKLTDSASTLLDGAQTVFISGNYAYITARVEDGLEILDISNPASPVHKGSIANGAGGALLDNAWSIFVSGNYAYVGSQTSDAMEIVDISNPANPVHKGSIANGDGGASLTDPYGIFVSGNYAYVATYGNQTSGALEIIDVSGANISNARIGALSVDTLQTNNFAQFDQNLSVRGGLNVGGPTQLLGEVSIGGGRATSTNMGGGGLTIFTNQTSSTLTSRVFDVSGSTGFIFNSGTSTWTGSDRNLVSFQTNGTDKFLFAADGSMIVNKASGFNLGKFYVDSLGNVNASGSLRTFANVTSTGNLYALTGTASTSILNGSSLTLGQGTAGYNSGMFNIDSNGNVNASGTITTANTLVASGITTVSLTVTGNVGTQGNTVLGNSDDAGGDTARIFGVLAIGAAPTGNAQLYLQASSTTAVPFLVQDTNSKTIGQLASSSIGGIVNGIQTTANGYALLTLGDSNGLPGGLSLMDNNTNSTGIVIYRSSAAIGAQLNAGTLILGDGASTSTLAQTTFTVNQSSGYNSGKFRIDSNGNTSVSGTLRVFGLSGSATTGGLQINATNSTTTFTSYPNNGAGSTGFVFNTQTPAGGAFSSSTDRFLAVFQNASINEVLISAGGNVYAKNSFIANSTDYGIGVGDVAEYVNLVAGETVEAGDVIMVDTNGLNQYRQSDAAYARNVAGVVSDSGAFLIGGGGANRAPLALAGLVRVKVTDENGPIAVGDYLVSASKPGYAMKYDIASPPAGGAGLVGMALESLAQGEGKILILINKGLVTGLSGGSVSLNVSANSQGQLVTNNDLDMVGQNIFNVLSIKGKDNKWMIDEDGYLIVKVKTKQGDKELYGLQSGQDKELVLSGSSQLENGLKKVELPLIDQEVIDPTTPIKVSVTLTGEAKGVFVSEKNYQGFTVKELGGGTSNASFDWILIAKRRPADYQEPVENAAPAEVPAPVVPEVTASSTPNEETMLAPTLAETPAETQPETGTATIIEETSILVTEPVSPSVEPLPTSPIIPSDE